MSLPLKPYRVCFYGVATHLGGAEKSLLELLVGIKTMNERVIPWVLLPKPKGLLIDALRREGISFEILEMPQLLLRMSRSKPIRSLVFAVMASPFIFFYIVQLIIILKKERINLIHTTGLKCHYFSAFVKLWTGIPVIWHLRDLFEKPQSYFLYFFKKILRIEWIANSKATALHFKEDQIPVVYNGLDPKLYHQQPNDSFRSIFQVDSSVPILGIVGVFARWKGQLEFLEMAETLMLQGKTVRFVLIGDTVYDTDGDLDFKKEVLERIQRLPKKEWVYCCGFQKDVTTAINGLDLIIHASLRPEPFGRVVLEAMACEVPVVASASGGILEMIEDGKTGCLFSHSVPGDLARQVIYLLDDSKRRLAMVREARQVFLKKFTLHTYAESMVKLCERICRDETKIGLLDS